MNAAKLTNSRHQYHTGSSAWRKKFCFLLISGCSLGATSQYFGILFHSLGLKIASVAALYGTLALTIYVLFKYRLSITWGPALLFGSIISFYPLSRIVFDALTDVERHHLTDTLVIGWSYYQLCIVALGIAVLVRFGEGYEVLSRFAIWIGIPLALLISYLGIKESASGNGPECARIGTDNFLIPIALLALYPRKTFNATMGWGGIACMFYVASYVGSRSYVLVSGFLAAGAVLAMFFAKHQRIAVVLFFLISIATYSGLFSVVQHNSAGFDGPNGSIEEKFQFDSLFERVGALVKTGNFVELYNWQGNSRQEILVDAFGQFTVEQWLFGRGISAEYESFISRSTIEVGWLQEVYRWGIPYVLLFLGIVLFACFRLFREMKSTQLEGEKAILVILCVIAAIRVIDGWIYGWPQHSTYSLLVFWAIMHNAVRPNRRF